MTLTEKEKGILMFYYIEKLKSFGLMEGGQYSMTEKGMKVAEEIISKGGKLTEEDIFDLFINGDFPSHPDHIAGIVQLILEVQDGKTFFPDINLN